MKQATVLSLFSGAGGLDLGFHTEGFEIKACIEVDENACKTIEMNKSKYLSNDTKIYCADITKLDGNSVKDDIGNVDFIIGGPPCQSFSAAGRRAGGVYGVNDTRGSLFWFYAQYLKIFKPKGFLFENVKGLLQANKSKDWEIIKQSFRELGYNLSYRVLDAADYGTPQHRERVIMVGWIDKSPFRFPRPIFGPNSSDKRSYITPRMVFSDVDDPEEDVPIYSGKYGHLLKDIPPGLNYSFYTERMRHPNPLFAWRSKFSGFLYKLDPDEPSKTLVAHQGKYDGPFHWKNRKLNIDELIRLQSFPIDYKFAGSRISIEKQIGNSVAPKLSSYLAKSVLKQVFHSDMSLDLLDSDEILKKPKKSRLREITQQNSFVKHNGSQLNLFASCITNWPTRITNLSIYEEVFENKCILKNGEWQIQVKKKNCKCNVVLKIEVDFIQPIYGTFEKIVCILKTNNILEFNFAWDFIHKLVDSSCSYGSLQPLYGHFTEPYPKFSLTTTTNMPESSITLLMKKMEDYSFLSKTHDYSEIRNLFDTNISILDLVRLLRSKGVDIRIHETNRTIPKNSFRICYPFCLPSWQPNYITWADAGKHKTGDLDIKKLIFDSAS